MSSEKQAFPSNEPCSCSNLSNYQYLGMDKHFAEISVCKCLNCGQNWLRYFYENEGFTGSGRYFEGAITDEELESLTVDNANSILESLEWYYYGGSYFDGKKGKTVGKINL